jgi:hypothetical protein
VEVVDIIVLTLVNNEDRSCIVVMDCVLNGELLMLAAVVLKLIVFNNIINGWVLIPGIVVYLIWKNLYVDLLIPSSIVDLVTMNVILNVKIVAL